jgi:hypothetical protein
MQNNGYWLIYLIICPQVPRILDLSRVKGANNKYIVAKDKEHTNYQFPWNDKLTYWFVKLNLSCNRTCNLHMLVFGNDIRAQKN